MKILVLNPQTDELLGELNNRGRQVFTEDKHIKEIAGMNTFEFSMLSEIPQAAYFSNRARVLIPAETRGLEELIVFQSGLSMLEGHKQVVSTAAYTEMNKSYVLEPRTYEGTLRELANLVLPYTDYQIGVVEDLEIHKINIEEHIGPYDFLKELASETNTELNFRAEADGTQFTGRYVDFLKRIGPEQAKEIVYGRDLIDIEVSEDSSQIVTELFCIGPEREDGTRLTAVVRDAEAFRRWNRKGKPVIGLYVVETSNQNMTLKELESHGRKELNKRIASIMEYTITATTMDQLFPGEDVVLGTPLHIKNEKMVPPLYADARIIRVERSISDPKAKVFIIGEVKTYTKDEAKKTFMELQAKYNMRVIRSETKPPGTPNRIWIQTTPGSKLEIPHIWSTELNDWVKVAPTLASEIGAETPQGAQEKANTAEQAAKDFASQEDVALSAEIHQTITRTREEVNLELAAKAGLNYVDGKFTLIDSNLADLLADTDALNTTVVSHTETLDGLNTNVSTLSQTVSGHVTSISNVETDITQLNSSLSFKAEQSQVDTILENVNTVSYDLSQLDIRVGSITSSVESLDSRLGSAESSITQMADSIEAKVNVNDVVAAINLSVDEINGARVNLIGAVTVLSDITGELGNITAGTIDGVTFLSGTGTPRRFSLQSGFAEFIYEYQSAGFLRITKTRLSDAAITIDETEADVSLNNTSLHSNGLYTVQPDSFAHYGSKRISLRAGVNNALGVPKNSLNLFSELDYGELAGEKELRLRGAGQVLSIKESVLRYNGVPVSLSGNRIIWQGDPSWMTDKHTIFPSRKLSDCPNGWKLLWSRFTNGAAVDTDWNVTEIPKEFPGFTTNGFWCDLIATGADGTRVRAGKYVYPKDDRLIGHASNGTGTESGQCLRAIIAY